MSSTNIELEIERIVDKFTEENKLNKISLLFKEPEGKEEEWKKNRGHYDREKNTIYIKLEKRSNAMIFRTLAHELAHVLSTKEISHKAPFWKKMDEQTLPFVKKNLQLEEERINLEKLANPLTNEDEKWDSVYLEPKRGKIYFFITKENLPQSWKLVREETIKGNLGIEAKVRTGKDSNDEKHQINIYFKDIQDKKDTDRILEKLLELGFNAFCVK